MTAPSTSRPVGPARGAWVALLLLALAVRIQPAWAADPAPPAFDPTKVELLYADDDWLVWVDAVLTEATRENRAQSHVRTYRLQRVGEATTRPAARTRGTHGHQVATVLEDGTLGLTYSTSLVWAKAEGAEPLDVSPTLAQPIRHGKARYRVLRGDRSGLCLQRYDSGDAWPVLYVPLSGRELLWEKSRQVTKEPVRVSGNPPAHVLGDLVACGSDVLDTKTGRRTNLGVPEFQYVRALGAEHVAGFTQVLSLAGGRARELPYWHQVFAIERGIAYAALPAGPVGDDPRGSVTILAIDLKTGGSPVPIAEARAEHVSTPYANLERRNIVRYGPVHLVRGSHGWWLFDGAGWRHRTWLDRVPR